MKTGDQQAFACEKEVKTFEPLSLANSIKVHFLPMNIQVILAGTLTGVQGDIRCKVLAALSQFLLTCNLSWDWPNRRL